MYYNLEQKMEYINAMLVNNKAADQISNQVFNITKPHEVKRKRDCSQFTLDEILGIYKSLFTSSVQRLIVINNYLKKYTDWCINNNLNEDYQNHYAEINSNMLMTCIHSKLSDEKILSREEVINIINMFDNVCDKFYTLAIFEGLVDKEMETVRRATMKNFIDKNHFRMNDGREFNISDKLYQLAELSSKTYEYVSIDGRHYLCKENGCIVKPKASMAYDVIPYSTIDTFLRSKIKLNYNMSVKKLYQSGKVDMVKNMWENGNYNSLEDCLSINRSKIEERYGKIQSISLFISQYGQIITG